MCSCTYFSPLENLLKRSYGGESFGIVGSGGGDEDEAAPLISAGAAGAAGSAGGAGGAGPKYAAVPAPSGRAADENPFSD